MRKLIVKDPAIVDLDTLKLIRQGLEEYALSSNEDAVALEAKALGTQLWDRALKAKPHDENLAREWFFFAFKQGHWKDAQKVNALAFSFCLGSSRFLLWGTTNMACQ